MGTSLFKTNLRRTVYSDALQLAKGITRVSLSWTRPVGYVRSLSEPCLSGCYKVVPHACEKER
jgi:hypothetical protein